MATQSASTDLTGLVAQLVSTPGEPGRLALIEADPELRQPDVIEKLCDEVATLVQEDVQQGERLAQAANWLATALGDRVSLGHSRRAQGHVLFVRAQYAEAAETYQQAIDFFAAAGNNIEVGRTLSSSLQALIYLSRYDDAFAAADRARQIFEKAGETRRLARLDVNVGNVLFRLDRFPEALDTYERAYNTLKNLPGEEGAVAPVLHNRAVCLISLNRYVEALKAYENVRAYCVEHHLPRLLAQADYNIAYLYYLRGEYPRAIELYSATRELCGKLDDRYHKALCDLDQSEMYLDLDLNQEAANLAQQAFSQFEDLGMGYEAAKSLVILAVANSHQGNAFWAIELFAKARELFVAEQNEVWPSVIDLYQGLVLFEEGRYFEARRACEAALRFFSESSLAGKAVLCELLLARLHLKLGAPDAARQACRSAIERIEAAEVWSLNYQAHFILGQIEEARGDLTAAHLAYLEAHGALKNLRSHLSQEELKISLLKDKLAVYESLVWTYLSRKENGAEVEAAFACVEQAKARNLSDLIAFRAHALPAPAKGRSDMVERIRELREELNWYYRRVDLEAIRDQKRSPAHLQNLRQRTRECEDQLVKAMGELGREEGEFIALQNAGTVELAKIRSVLPDDAVLLEYYNVRNTTCVCLLDRDRLEIVPLTPQSRVRNLMRAFSLQFSKFRPGAEYVANFSATLLRSTQGQLRDLYAELIEPVRQRLKARHLLIVPHDLLYQVPFHALLDGDRYLIDDFTISYAVSATSFYLCRTKEPAATQESLVLGVKDTPAALDEVLAVSAALRGSRLAIGKEATEEALATLGSRSRYVHLATGALIRKDNPMLSAIPLANAPMTLFDFYHLRLAAELVTFTGCSSGLNPAAGGDELLGLARGVLYAGARAVQLPLWDAGDPSTARWMQLFYHHLNACPNKAVAQQRAMQELRLAYPHPYHWAPFVLIGNPYFSPAS